jgi:hypothetical protein
MVTIRNRKVAIWVAAILGFGAFLVAATVISVRLYRRYRPITLRGAVTKQNSDARDQSPIADVVASAADELAVGNSKSDFSGSFSLRLRPEAKPGQHITLTFRHPGFRPLDLSETVSDKLYVVRMVPLHDEVGAEPNKVEVTVENISVRYSTETATTESIGSGVKTFQVVNTGNVPCDKHSLCSPDGKWKAGIGSASLDAGEGNVFRNARVACIAGPCPFTKVNSDGFSHGGRSIKVSMLDWSDTTTFLLQAEVFRPGVGDVVRESYPVIFGRAMNFTLPAAAKGPSVEAEMNGSRIVFALGPTSILSWADCHVRVQNDQTKNYRCELKAGYRFR